VELGRKEGELTLNLGTENVLLPEGLEVIAIDPNVITVEVERAVTRRIRVVPDLTGQPVPGARVDEPEVFPSQVLVSGPASMVASTEVLSTRPVSLTGRSTTFEERVPVQTPDPLIRVVDPTRVTVRVPILPPRNSAPPAQTEER
ncbi:MAG TPA: CdaR family protein, partial [Thermoanaerobaculia bacterium]|nr:CdaR family protein [Thermoanaerobaculia bacterium]